MKMITVCSLDCPDACSLIVSVMPDGRVHIKGNSDHPITDGFTCAKIKKYSERLRSPERIVTPLLRSGETWQVIGWDEALDMCAHRIQMSRSEPSSILHLHGEGGKGVLKCADDLFFGRLGAGRGAGSLCDTAGIAACIADFGSLETHDIRDIVNAGRIVNWGRDLSRSSIHVASFIRKARKSGTKVFTVSPGGDGNGPFTDSCIRIRPGTDRFLAAAVIRLFVERRMFTKDVLTRTRNWQIFHDLLLERSVEELSFACGVSLTDVECLYDFYAGSEPVATLYGWGLQRYRYGGETVRFINALALVSGNVGRPGTGVYYEISSLRNFNLDWASAYGQSERRTFLLPIIGQSILNAQDPPVRMIWVNGFNVVNQAPDSRATAEAFRRVEFKVVVDAFMNDTAQRADLILPCTLFLEQEDIVGSFLHNYVHYAAPLIQPPKDARDDFWIFRELGKRLDPPVRIPDRETCLRKSMESPHLDISLEELRKIRFTEAAWPTIAYEGMTFKHHDCLYRFPEELHDEPPFDPEFPLRLLSLIRRDAIHSQISPKEQEGLPKVWVSKDNPVLREIDTSRDVFLVSQKGRLPVEIRISSDLHPEAVIYRRGDWMSRGGGVNQIIDAGLTDMGDGAPSYSQYARLENDER